MADSKRYSIRRSSVVAGLLVLLIAISATSAYARAVKIRLGDNHRMAVEYLMKQEHVSAETAARLAHQFELKNGNRILDTLELPEGAQMDFYTVRNHEDPTKRVEFQGRGMLVDASSYAGRQTKNTLRSLLSTSERSGATQLLRQARDNGFMIVPVGLGDRRGPPVGTAAAQTRTIGVICPEFPHWNDMRPQGTGATGYQSGTYFQADVTTPPGVKMCPVRPGQGQDGPLGVLYLSPFVPGPRWPDPTNNSIENATWENQGGSVSYDREYYADSVGGPINTNGVPLGMQANAGAWSGGGVTYTTNADGHPRFGGDIRPGSEFPESPVQLRQRLYDLFFNKGLTSSLYTWFYQNSHAHISVEGSPSSIIGWVDDHHILDRLPRGSGNYYSVQPGTPFLRPQDPNGQAIVRASLWQNDGTNGLTLFFRRDVSLSLSQVRLWVYQTVDIDTKTAGTQNGTVEILHNLLSGSSTIHMDPWDARRWTITDVNWRFQDLNPDPPTKYIGYSHARGRSWYCEVSGQAARLGASPVTWDNTSTGYRNQGQGCGALDGYVVVMGYTIPRTLFYTGDTVIPQTGDGVTANRVGSAKGNRLLSFCYYSHHGSYGDSRFATFNPNTSAYQLETLRNAQGDMDPIAGYVDDARDRRPRFYPFDHDMVDHGRPNLGGYFGTSTGYHTDGNCWSDVTQVMKDQGITYSNYNQLIFMYPGPTMEGETTTSAFIAHSGNPIPVSTGAGVTLLAHEICHNFGTIDLYDVDFYANNATPRPSPLYSESLMMTPYSVMAHGGFRLDPYHKLNVGWATSTNVVRDLGFTTISQVEQTTRDPVILKLPGHPLAVYADKNPAAPVGYPGGQGAWDALKNPASWPEYFLVENRNVTSGAYAGDKSPHGMYIFHVDKRTAQRKEAWHTVALVQADGCNDLETYPDGYPQTAAMLNGDPYPGLENNRYLTERSQRLGNGRNSPTSWSNGDPDSGGATIRPGTPTDSFVRITGITGPLAGPGGTPNAAGDPMTAYVYVEPAEIIATHTNLVPPHPPIDPIFYQVHQGTKNFAFMHLNLDNDGTYPNLSTNPVTVNTIRVYEVGTSLTDANIAVARLYEDTNGNSALDVNEDDNSNGMLDSHEDDNHNGVLDAGEDRNGNGVLDFYEDHNYNGTLDTVAVDTLLKTAAVSGDYIEFTNLGYEIPLNQDRDLIIAYDVSHEATTNPTVTIGTELTTHEFIIPNPPGCVQQRARLAAGSAGPGYNFGAHWFPLSSTPTTKNTAKIIEEPDTLHVEVNDLAPANAQQGETDVTMMQLILTVTDQDSVLISGIKVDEIEDAVSGVDISVARAYHDTSGNGQIDGGDPLLAEAAFAGGSANLSGMNFTVTHGTTSYVILAVNVTSGATLGRKIQLELKATPPCITLASNPADPFHDSVDYSNFDHQSGVTEIQDIPTGPNVQPGPPVAPFLPNGVTVEVPDVRPTLSWGAATDPDFPPDDAQQDLNYYVELDDDDDWGNPPLWTGEALAPNLLDPVTLDVGIDLTDNTRYYWRVRTRDRLTPDGLYSDWAGTFTFWANSVNQPPNAPDSGFSPTNGVTIATQYPRLRCNQAFDPDPSDQVSWPTWPANALTYVFQVTTDNTFTTVPYQYSQVGNADPVYVEFLVPDELTDETDWYWRVKARDDQGAESGWSVSQHFYIDTGNMLPWLDPPASNYMNALDPKYGTVSPVTNFEFRILYWDAENDAPVDGVWVEIFDEGAAPPGTRYEMHKLNPTDNNYTDGVEYIIGLPSTDAALGYGHHTFRFLAHGDTVEWPMLWDPPEAGDGPIIGSNSIITLMDGTWTAVPDPLVPPTVPGYEEGDPVYIELQDADENVDPLTAQTVTVTVFDEGMADVESVVLTETGVDTGVFQGSIPMLGRLEQPADPQALNVISGPTGNVIQASYTDKDCGPDCPPVNVDSSSDTALVTDTQAPTAIGGALGATSGAHGRSINLDWSAYDYTTPPTQVDVVAYEVYYSDTAAFTITDLTAIPGDVTHAGTVTPGSTTSFTIPGLTPNTAYHVAVVPRDSVPNITAAPSTGPITPTDISPPTLVPVDPLDLASEVPLDTHIIFRLVDPGEGVNQASVRVWVVVDGGAPLEITTPPTGWALTTSGTPDDLQFDYTPPAGFFDLNQNVVVRVYCEDQAPAPNVLGAVPPTAAPAGSFFTFQTKSDIVGPQITQQSPADGSTNVLPSVPISFHITDDKSGVNTATLAVDINGADVTANCTVDDTNPLDVVVTYPATPPSIVPWGAAVTVTVNVSDNAGNPVQAPNFWSYDTQADNDPPSITDLKPAAGATGVQIDTTISFRLTDTQSGIDDATLQVFVNGTQVPDAELVRSGAPNSLTITYSPLTLFNYNDVVTVRVVVSDIAGNALADEAPVITAGNGYEWQFTCKPPPQYRIVGTITDQDAAALPNVIVRALAVPGGNEVANARSDGNGTYIIDIELGGTFDLVPERDQYDFNPLQRQVTIVDADVTGEDFVGTLRTYTVSGNVTDGAGGPGLPGVNVTCNTHAAVTDAQGDYTIPGVPNGRYTATPTLANYSFRPTSRTVVVDGAAVTGVDFEAVGQTFTVSGTVQDFDGNRLQGVRVTDGTRSAITNEAGQYTLGDVPAGTWNISASKTGYKITPDAIALTLPPSATGVNFVAYLSFANSFPVGINFLGVPCHVPNEDPVVVFGTNSVARWDPNGTPPDYLLPGVGPGQALLEVRPGRGFFVRLADGDLEVPGRPVSTVRPFTLTLGPVWNMAANMYTAALPFANIIPGLPGSIRAYGYVYDPVSGGYLLIAGTPGVNVARTVIYPWEGIWLRTSGGPATAAVTPPPTATSAGARSVEPQSVDLGTGGWALPIVATAGNRQDATTTVGVGPALGQAIQLDNPPMAPETVDVYLLGADGRYLAQDVKASNATALSWEFEVVTDLANAQVAVALPDLSQLPNDRVVYLTDLDANKRIYARTMSAYSFTSGDAGGKRRFKLEIAPKSEAGLVVANAAAATSARGVVVTYNVSRECQVSVQVTNIAGRVIRTLCEGKATSSGLNTMSWDLKSGRGTRVPSGRYLIQVRAVSEDGQQAQAVTSALVRR